MLPLNIEIYINTGLNNDANPNPDPLPLTPSLDNLTSTPA